MEQSESEGVTPAVDTETDRVARPATPQFANDTPTPVILPVQQNTTAVSW